MIFYLKWWYNLKIFIEPFELARHSSTSSDDCECIEHGGRLQRKYCTKSTRNNYQSELEEYEEPIIKAEDKQNTPTDTENIDIASSNIAAENEKERKRSSASSMKQPGTLHISIYTT